VPQSLGTVLRDHGIDTASVAALSPPVRFPHGASIHLLRWAR